MITYKCPTCKTPQRGKLPVACLKCQLASEAAEQEVAYKEILQRLKFLDKLLPQVASITEYLSTNHLGVWGGDSLPCALELIKKHVPLPGATIELSVDELRFLKQVAERPGNKWRGGEPWGGADEPLWEKLEALGLVKCTGSYRWETTFDALSMGVQARLGVKNNPKLVDDFVNLVSGVGAALDGEQPLWQRRHTDYPARVAALKARADSLEAATIELPSQPVRRLADRLATAVCGDRQLEGFDVELLSQGHTGSRLSALIVEMAGHEAEAYALQDQVDEANSSITALEQRLAEAEKLLKEVHRGVLHEGWIVSFTIPGRIEAWLATE